MKDHAAQVVDNFIEKEKKRKQIYSITLDPELYDDAIKAAPDGNFSKLVTVALEEYLDREVEKRLWSNENMGK